MPICFLLILGMSLSCSCSSSSASGKESEIINKITGMYYLTCGDSTYRYVPSSNIVVEYKKLKLNTVDITTKADKANGYIFSGYIEIDKADLFRFSSIIKNKDDIKNIEWEAWQDWEEGLLFPGTISFWIKSDLSYEVNENTRETSASFLSCPKIDK